MEAWRLKIKTCRPVFADLQHFDEDPDKDLSENSDHDPHLNDNMDTLDTDPHLNNADPHPCRRLWFNLFKILQDTKVHFK
jgi:hypothetical protein